MLVPYLLLEENFNQLCKNRSKSILDLRIKHTPTINEGGREKTIKDILNPEWMGDSGNTSTVDMIMKSHSIEYKSSNYLKTIELNSTPITKTSNFQELPKKAQAKLSNYHKNFIFIKEYLFFIEDIDLYIFMDSQIETMAFENRKDYDDKMKEANKLKGDFSFFEELESYTNVMLAIKNEADLYSKYKEMNKIIKENKIIQNYDNKGTYSLNNKNHESYMNLRERSMWSYNLKGFLNSNGLFEEEIQFYSSLVILNKNNFLHSHLVRYSNLIILETPYIVILGYKK